MFNVNILKINFLIFFFNDSRFSKILDWFEKVTKLFRFQKDIFTSISLHA